MMGGYGWGSGVGGGFGVGAMLLMSLFGLMVLVGIVVLIIWAVRQGEHRHPGPYAQAHHPTQAGQQWTPTQPGAMTPGGPGGGGAQAGRPAEQDPAVAAVRERYARGEITKEQFDQIMRDLGY